MPEVKVWEEDVNEESAKNIYEWRRSHNTQKKEIKKYREQERTEKSPSPVII
jgi:hypothetical protein